MAPPIQCVVKKKEEVFLSGPQAKFDHKKTLWLACEFLSLKKFLIDGPSFLPIHFFCLHVDEIIENEEKTTFANLSMPF